MLHQNGVSPDPMGADFDYAQAFNAIDYAALKAGITALMTDKQALVAGRLRALWPVHDPHGLARGRDLSGDRRPWRCGKRAAAF